MPLLLDISGLEALFKTHFKALCTTSFRIVEDKDIAQDIVRDVYLKLWKTRNKVFMKTLLKDYLFRCTMEASINYVKSNGVRLPVTALKNEEADTRGLASLSKEIGFGVDEAVRTLPPVSRLIFILNRYERLGFRETAARLNMSVEAVEKEMARAMRHFFECLR